MNTALAETSVKSGTITETTEWMTSSCTVGLVSIIIPTHNRADLIRETLDSVFAQTYRPLEVIVVDDASTDNTKEIIEEYSCRLSADSPLTYVRQERLGAQAARNLGCRLSRGEYVQFLDSDDIMVPKKLALQVESIEAESAAAAYGPWRCLYERLPSRHGKTQRIGRRFQTQPQADESSMLRGYLASRWFCPVHSYLFRRTAMVDVGPWDLTLQRRQDADYLVRMLLPRRRFVFVADSGVSYRRHGFEHIGKASNFQKHFKSLVGLIVKQSQLLSQHNELECYRDAQIEAIARLCDDSWVLGYGEGIQACLRTGWELFGDQGVVELESFRRPWLALFARRYVSHPFRRLAGEYYIERLRDLLSPGRI